MSIESILARIANITNGGRNTAAEVRDVLTDMTSTLSGSTFSGTTDNIPEGGSNLYYTDGRINTKLVDYSLTGHTHNLSELNNDVGYLTGATSTDNDYVTGSTFNTTDGILTFSRLSGGTFNVDLDGRYLTGFTATINTDDYVTSGSFNPANGEVILTRLSGGTVTYDLDGRYTLTGETILRQYINTGFVSGLHLTINTDSTKFNIDSGTYFITDYSNILNPTPNLIFYSGSSGNTPTYLASANATYIALDENGNIIQKSSPFTSGERRVYCTVGAVIHSNRTNINVVNGILAPIVGDTNQLHDLMRIIGSLNIEGNVYSPNGSNLKLNKSGGSVFGLGINAHDNDNPHVLATASQTALTFRYRLQNGTEYPDTTNINPLQWDNNGVLTTLSNNKFSIQHIHLFQSNITRIQYGQKEYSSMDEAKTFVASDPFITEQNIGENSIFRAYLIVKKEVINLSAATASNTAHIILVDKFGSVIGGAATAITYASLIATLGYIPANVLDLQNYSLTGHTHTASQITDFSDVVTGNTAVLVNTAKTGITETQATNILINTSKTGITLSQSNAIISNTSGLNSHTGDTSIHFTQSGITITESQISDLQDYSLTGHTHTVSNITDFPTNVSSFSNDIGYITGFTDTNDYVTGSTFNTTDGILTFTRLSGGTFNVDLDNRYSLTGHTHSQYLTGYTDSSNEIITGVTVTGTLTKTITLTQRDGTELTANFTDSTGGGATGEEITGITFNPTTGDLDLNTNSGSTITTNLDNRYSLTGHTHDLSGLTNTGHTHTVSEVTDFPTIISYFTNDLGYITGFTDTNDNVYVTGSTFNTGDGVLTFTNITGGTFNVDLDGRYLTGYTATVNTDDYVSSATFNTTNGILTLTRLSGGTVTVDLDDRYSLTGHTHTVSEISNFPTNVSSFTNDVGYLTGSTTVSITETMISSGGESQWVLTSTPSDLYPEQLYNNGSFLVKNTDWSRSGDTITFSGDSIPLSGEVISYFGNSISSPTSNTLNPNVFIPTLTTDFTSPDSANANKIWEVQSDIDLGGGTFTAPANIIIFLNGGNVNNIGTFVGNKTSFKFISPQSKFDLFSATVSGTFLGKEFYLSNLGGKDDDLSTSDNKPVIRESLKIVNYLSGKLIFNKVNTGKYWMGATDFSTDLVFDDSPFFGNTIPLAPYIMGNGTTIEINGDVEIKEIANRWRKKFLFMTYNGNDIQIINNGVISGDRDIHDYFTKYYIKVAPSSGTFFNFRLLELDPDKDNTVLKTIDVNIPITSGQTLSFVQNEVATYINTEVVFSGYTVAANPNNHRYLDYSNYFDVTGQPGTYFRLVVTSGDTNLITGTDIDDSNETHEDGVLIRTGSLSDNYLIKGGVLQKSTGEAIIDGAQGNGGTAVLPTDWTRCDVNFTTGAITPNPTTGNYIIMNEHRNITGYAHPWGYGMFANGSVKSLYPTYWILWEDGTDTALSGNPISPLLELNRKIPLNPLATKARIIFDYTPNYTSFSWFYFDSLSYSKGGRIENVTFYRNRRQHVSNPSPDTKFINCDFDRVGGAEPNWDIDWEDLGKLSTDGSVEGCTFHDTALGSLILKGTEGTKILNNIFEAPTSSKSGNAAIATSWSRKTQIAGNTFTRRGVGIDIQSSFTNNTMTDAVLTIGAGGAMVSDNVLIDVTIRDEFDSSVTAGTSGVGGAQTSIISNQILRFSKPWVNRFPQVLREIGSIGFENVQFIFNDVATLHWTPGALAPLNVLTNSSIQSNWFARNIIPNDGIHKGYHKNTTIVGLYPSSGNLHNASAEFYVHTPIQGINSSTSISLYNGYVVDGIVHSDIVSNGWLKLVLGEYASTGTGPFPTMTLLRPKVIVPVETSTNVGYLDNTSNGSNEWTTVFRTPLKDVSLIVEDGYFENLGNVTGYFGKFEQYGPLTFKNTKFKSHTTFEDILNLTDVTRVPVTTGNFYFKDMDLDNVYVWLRPQDRIINSKPSNFSPYYIDNVTALAALGEGISYRDGGLAEGTITCSGVTVGETVTVNGLVYTAVSGTPTEGQFNPFTFDTPTANNSRTATNIAIAIQNDTRVGTFSDVRAITDGVGNINLRQKTAGTSGNTTLSSSNGASLILSGAAMTGGIGTGEYKVTY